MLGLITTRIKVCLESPTTHVARGGCVVTTLKGLKTGLSFVAAFRDDLSREDHAYPAPRREPIYSVRRWPIVVTRGLNPAMSRCWDGVM